MKTTAKPGPCAGCGDRVPTTTEKVHGLRLCPLCSQVPDEVLGLLLDETVRARDTVDKLSARLSRVVAKVRAAQDVGEMLSLPKRLDLLRDVLDEMKAERERR